MAHLLEEPDIEDWKGGVQHIVQCQEPALIQRLGKGERRDTAVSSQPADAKLSEMEVRLYLRRPTQTALAPVESSQKVTFIIKVEAKTRVGLSEI